MIAPDPQRIRTLLVDDDRPSAELDRLATLVRLLADLPVPPDPLGLYPRYGEMKDALARAIDAGDSEELEAAFLELYCHVHGYEAPYSPAERQQMDRTGGYWCHAGGVSPILKAGDWITPGTVSADFGAGNGLQMLLTQRLYPHAKTVQIEISEKMVEGGRALQEWLAIPEERVEWIVDDVCNHVPAGMDFVYLYRPVRPTTEAGRGFYERFAAAVATSDRPATIFSIADCLRDFVPPAVRVFYTDGHLTCFRYEP